MNILVCGSRSIKDKKVVFENLGDFIAIGDTVIQGGCQGVDTFASEWCLKHQIATITVRPVRTDIKEYYLHRNSEMIGMCDKVIAFWDNASRGTKFVIDYANKRRKNVTIVHIDKSD
jgi:predicted Rossmann fold nucleotide-binding protein DprA/Smf involved in DNA uptake